MFIVGRVTGYADLPAGTIFSSDFRVERRIASGGMGAVYVAHQISTGRRRALKLMHPTLAREDGMRRRFEQEARIGSHVRSNHLVDVIAAGVDPTTGMPWLAMELLEGEDLATHVARSGPVPLSEAARILGQACHALAAAHAAGVVHRDLKPENVFLSQAHQAGTPTLVKLLDLGIAKFVAEHQARETAPVGTPLWMAPEQTGGKVGPTADVWAIGLLVFWMLTGRSYWRGADPSDGDASLMRVLREIVVDPIEPASARARSFGCAPALPAGFDAWFARCVARDPAERFADAAEANAGFSRLVIGSAETQIAPFGSGAATVRQLAQRVEPSSARDPTARRSRRATLLAGGGALALCLAAFAFAWNPVTRSHPAPGASASADRTASRPEGSGAEAPAKPNTPAMPSGERVEADLTNPDIIWGVPLANSPRRGPADALVTIVEFANYQCPYSKGVEPELQKLLQEFSGKVRLVWKDDPLAVHSQAEVSATVAREARAQNGEQGFWAAHDTFLERGFKPSVKTLLAAARTLGLDVPRVEKAMTERAYAADIAADADLADDFATTGTPYFFVNGRRVPTTPDLGKLRAAVAEELLRVESLVAKGTPRSEVYDILTDRGRRGVPIEIKAFPLTTVTAPTRGGAQSQVNLLEFCAFDSLLCRLVDQTVDDLLKGFSEQLSVVWVDVPSSASEDSTRASLAARAAYRHGGVDGFDKMRRLLLESQRKPSAFAPWALAQYADSIGLPRDEFSAGIRDPVLLSEIEADARKARSSGVASDVPAFLVCRSDFCAGGGYFLTGGQPRRAFEKRIRLLLNAPDGPLPTSSR